MLHHLLAPTMYAEEIKSTRGLYRRMAGREGESTDAAVTWKKGESPRVWGEKVDTQVQRKQSLDGVETNTCRFSNSNTHLF